MSGEIPARRKTDTLLFLDETGTSNYLTNAKFQEQVGLLAQGKNPNVSVIFGLGGVLFRRDDYVVFDKRVRELKNKHFGREDFALHEFDIRKMKKPPFDQLRSQTKWMAFREDFKLVVGTTHFVAIVASLHKIAMVQEHGELALHPYRYCLRVILERVINARRQFGNTCRIVAEDREAGANADLEKELLHLQFHGGSNNDKPTVSAAEVRATFDPGIVFPKKSDFHPGIEMADLVTGPIVRHLHGLPESKTRSILDVVVPKLRRGSAGQVRGYGIMCLPDYPNPCPL